MSHRTADCLRGHGLALHVLRHLLCDGRVGGHLAIGDLAQDAPNALTKGTAGRRKGEFCNCRPVSCKIPIQPFLCTAQDGKILPLLPLLPPQLLPLPQASR